MDITALVHEKIKVEGDLKNGANWFYWIAILSIVNSFLLVIGTDLSFLVSLGIVEIIDFEFWILSGQEFGFTYYNTIGFVINTILSSTFLFYGLMANKGKKWAFVLGIVLFSLDGILMLLMMDFLSVAFHVFALFGIIKGLRAIKKLSKLEEDITYARNNPHIEENPMAI